MEFRVGRREELLGKRGVWTELLAVMTMPPVGLPVVGDEDNRPLVALCLLDHLFPDDEIAKFISRVGPLLGVLESRWNLFRVSLLPFLAYRRYAFFRRLG